MSDDPAGYTRRFVPGQAGRIELLLDTPSGQARGIALVTHPQPLLGGSASHKIPALLAKACREDQWLAVRPNFRGVGASEGVHDAGRGEAEDMIALAAQLRGSHPALPLALLGFSFGAFVLARVAAELARRGEPAQHVVLAGMPAGVVVDGRSYDPPALPPGSMLVHGERDMRVPLEALLRWADAHAQAVLVIPGADHFFRGKLPLLRDAMRAELGRGPRLGAAPAAAGDVG